jgi:hypothetical protein
VDDKATSWFLIAWPEHASPQIVMEFWTEEEARAALELATRVSVDVHGQPAPAVTGVCPASVLIEDPFMQHVLCAWDEQLDELESIERAVLRGGRTPR